MATGFEQSAAFSTTLAAGISDPPFNPFTNLPGGLFGQLAAQSLLGPYAQNQFGMSPFGTGNLQNIYDRMSLQQYGQMQQGLMAEMSRHDAARLTEALRGMSLATRGVWTAEQEQVMRSIEPIARAVAPMAAYMSPQDILSYESSVLGGRSGVAFSRFFSEGARYARDPATGFRGMGAASMSAVGSGVYEELFGGSGRFDLKGLSAGQAGQMYDVMQRSGMMPGQAEIDRALASPGGQAMAGDAGALQNFQKDQVVRQIRNYTGVISAMKDIFGDLGNPNAPVPELINALEAITNGGMSQMDPGRLEMTARNFRNLSRNSGIEMPVAMMMLQRATAATQQFGMNPLFATEATMGTFGFIGAMQQSGLMQSPMWGMANQTVLGQMDTNLRLAAASSGIANRLGALARFGTAVNFGGQTGEILDLMRRGTPEAIAQLDRMRAQGLLSEGAITQAMVRDSGGAITEGMAVSAMRHREANMEFVHREGLMNVVRPLQGGELYQQRIMPALQSAMMAAGIDQRQAEALGARLSEALRNTPREDLSTQERANATISRLLREQGGQLGISNDRLQAMGPHVMGTMADIASQTGGYGSLANMLALHDPRAMRGTAENMLDSGVQSLHQSALAGVGQGTMSKRLMKLLMDTDASADPDAILKIVLQATGFEDNTPEGDLAKKFSQSMAKVLQLQRGEQARIDKLHKQRQAALERGDTAEAERLQGEIQQGYDPTIMRQMKSEMSRFEEFERAGILKGVREQAEALAAIEGKEGADQGPQEMTLRGVLTIQDDRQASLEGTGSTEGTAASPIPGE